MSKFSVRGITLIELLVAVAVVAIIAAVVYPSFMDGLRKSRRAEAIKGLLTMQLKQEEYRITSAAYSTNPADLGSPSSAYYSFTVSGANTTTYTLQASASSPQIGDTGCAIMTLKKDDTKGPLPECWN